MKTVTIQFIVLCTFFYVQPMEKTQSKKNKKTDAALRDFNIFLIKYFMDEKKIVKLPEEKKYDQLILLADLPCSTKDVLQEIFNEMDKS